MRHRSATTILLPLITITALIATSPDAQIIHGQPVAGDVRVTYSSWKLEDTSGTTVAEIDQFTVPVTGFVPVRENLEAVVYIATSSNTLTQSGSDFDLSGVGNARIQLNHSFLEDQVLASVGINLPTGKRELTVNEELPVLQFLSQNYLDFPMRRFGEGFGFSLLAGGAQQFDEWRVGGGVMYQFNGTYTPYEGLGDYNPGDVFSINAGADWQRDQFTVTGNTIFTAYSNDKFDGEEVFKQSTQFGLDLTTTYRAETFATSLGLGYLTRGKNSFITPGSESKLRVFGDEFTVRLGITRIVESGWYLKSVGQIHLIGSNDQGFGKSTIYGAGIALGKKFGERVSFDVGGRYFTGNADDDNLDVSGFQVSGGLSAGL